VGSGPYRLVSAVAGQRYTYLLRTTPTPGLPRRVVVTVVPGAQRRADLLLAGHLDLTTLDGAQRDRVDAAGLDDASAPTGTVLLVFDEAGGRPAADPGVRRSLVQALDLGALATAAAGGHGTPLRSLEPVVPPLCRQDTVGASPSFDVEKAAAGLQAAGWRLGPDGKRSRAGVPLVLHLVHPRDGGAGLVTAAGLLAQEWSALGARVVGTTSDAPAGTLPAGTGWDAVLAPLAVPDPAAWPAVLGSAVDDGAYTAAVRRAVDAATPSCTDWTTAERALVSGADVVPVTATTTGAYGLHATYRLDEDGLVDPAGVVLTR
jgi:peptide/nickel transport system substrate-binding protein